MVKKNLLILLLFLFLTSCNDVKQKSEIVSYPTNFFAKVIGVKDGDTIEVLFNNNPIVIRLEHIDCPEKKQPFGKRAKQFASDFCFGKIVNIISKGKTDRYKRLIAEVKIENGNILNKELVRNGLAMHYKKYSKAGEYDLLENRTRLVFHTTWELANRDEAVKVDKAVE